MFGTPISIVSDQDLRITSEFWAEICSMEIIKQQLSTAFHPQTNGQSEALNCIVKDYLHAYCINKLTAWVNLLPLTQFAYNNSINTTTKITPNNLLYGMDYNIRLYTHSIPKERILEAHARIKKMHELCQRLQEHLTNTNK
jgi:hypothetical protein